MTKISVEILEAADKNANNLSNLSDEILSLYNAGRFLSERIQYEQRGNDIETYNDQILTKWNDRVKKSSENFKNFSTLYLDSNKKVKTELSNQGLYEVSDELLEKIETQINDLNYYIKICYTKFEHLEYMSDTWLEVNRAIDNYNSQSASCEKKIIKIRQIMEADASAAEKVDSGAAAVLDKTGDNNE